MKDKEPRTPKKQLEEVLGDTKQNSRKVHVVYDLLRYHEAVGKYFDAKYRQQADTSELDKLQKEASEINHDIITRSSTDQEYEEERIDMETPVRGLVISGKNNPQQDHHRIRAARRFRKELEELNLQLPRWNK